MKGLTLEKNLFLVKPVAEASLEEITLGVTKGLTLETSPFHVKHATCPFLQAGASYSIRRLTQGKTICLCNM